MKRIVIASLFALLCAPVMADADVAKTGEEVFDSYYKEAFEVPAEMTVAREIVQKATATDTVFQVAQATNTATTGHGNVRFRVTYNSTADHWDLLIWSQNSYAGCTGYRKWWRVSNPTFGAWPANGGALCVGWPPTYNNMHENIQIIDHDLDGDLDVFMMLETSEEVWTVYLYKNLEIN